MSGDPLAPVDDALVCEFVEQVVSFNLGGQRYALPIDRVQEIQQIVEFAEVPTASGSAVGMINLRGEVITAIDVRRLVGLDPAPYTLETPMVICRISDEERVALLVDEVDDVVELPEGCLQAVPQMHALSSKMMGVARLDDGLVYLLDLELLLAPVMAGGL